MSQIKTTFAKNDPFASVRKPKVKPVFTEIGELEITNDPLPSFRAMPDKKYEPLFKSLKPGNRIKCKPHETNKIANALRKWLKDTKSKCTVKSTSKYHDGMGGVWLVK